MISAIQTWHYQNRHYTYNVQGFWLVDFAKMALFKSYAVIYLTINLAIHGVHYRPSHNLQYAARLYYSTAHTCLFLSVPKTVPVSSKVHLYVSWWWSRKRRFLTSWRVCTGDMQGRIEPVSGLPRNLPHPAGRKGHGTDIYNDRHTLARSCKLHVFWK